MSTSLWTGAELSALGWRFEPPGAKAGFAASGVSIDSRSLRAGDLFIAIHGEARDGHEFVAAALKAGAAGALVDRVPEPAAAGTLLYTEDTLKGIELLGAAARERARAARRLAVTGSVGKTGTKEALAHVLAGFGRTHASVASYNNMWGVPLTLARMPRDTEFGIFEIGMNHAGEIIPLTAQVKPEIAIVTTVEPVHLEFFGSVEAIADAKGEIFSGLQPGGTAILNRDNPHFARLKGFVDRAGAGRLIGFGFGSGAGAEARLISFSADPAGSLVEADILGTEVRFRLAMPGRHIAMNMLAVLSAVAALGLDVRAAAERLESLAPPSGRGAREEIAVAGGTITLVDESYNANPASMRAALSNLAEARPGAAGGRRIAALGDMLELGPTGPDLHKNLVESTNGVDLIYCCGPLMKALFDALPTERQGAWAPRSDQLAEAISTSLKPGDILMVKGSLGSRMKQIVEDVRRLGSGQTKS